MTEHPLLQIYIYGVYGWLAVLAFVVYAGRHRFKPSSTPKPNASTSPHEPWSSCSASPTRWPGPSRSCSSSPTSPTASADQRTPTARSTHP